MVGQSVILYESDSAHGTLYVSIDDSKFFIQCHDTLKIELLLDDEQDGDLTSRRNESGKENSSVEYGKLGDYVDLSKPPLNQRVSKKSEKVVNTGKDHLGNLISTKSDELSAKVVNQNEGPRKKRKRKLIDIDKEKLKAKENSNNRVEAKIIENESDYVSQNFQESEDMDSLQGPPGKVIPSVNEDIPLADKALNEDLISCNNDDVTSTSNENVRSISQCRDCSKIFKNTQALKDHKKVKTNEIKCDECLEVFPYQAFLQVHKKSNHGSSGPSVIYKDDQYWYSCNTCGALEKTLVKLQIHNLTHTGEGAFQCCLCHRKFWGRNTLGDHIRKDHKGNGNLRCRWCYEMFPGTSALARHKLNCKEIKCHLCESVFPNKTSRNQHYKDAHPNDVLKCELCVHMFSSQEEFDSHMENHSKFKKKQCTFCGLFFSCLRKHMLTHKNPSDFTESEFFYCDKCPAKFVKQTAFSRHQKDHIGDRPYQCPNCPKAFTSSGGLYKHVKRCKPILPFMCQVCDEKIESIDQLKSHMATHIDDNSILFQCSLCTQSFMYRNSLEAHMQMKHPQNLSSNIIDSVVTEFESISDSQVFSTAATSFVESTTTVMVVPGMDCVVPNYEVVTIQQ